MTKFPSHNSYIQEGVLKIDFPQDFGVTPTSMEQCLAILFASISEQQLEESENIENKPILSVEYQGRSSTSILESDEQEELDIFQVIFRKITKADRFDPSAY
ncbi:hypothetical protein PN441_17940 [Spirulina major CS-329]|uniref:hypothetical protein n=1 Tax=Spirulina TaxID=1154 RepID=UPI00232CCB20|nr:MULTISPECIES: hypothetical protein [Spirulina]MDB9494558.1 hypothetical protein [Spirulina subsalsa CS-330]MDB9504962.1 hypothetical protein [Spirulina major CS-329]